MKAAEQKKSFSKNDTKEHAYKYAKSEFENTYYLGFREIPHFLEKYSSGKRAIDYGCGAGRSTRFLLSQGFEVIAVDISKKMLEQACRLDDRAHYLHIQNARIPTFDNLCDLFFSSFVLITIPFKDQLLHVFKEAYRCLRKEGIFIIVTGSEELYSHEWLSYDTNYEQNANLHSGDIARIRLKDLDIEFINYYWTDDDYSELIRSSGFKILEKHFPYGKYNENRKWISETEFSPYAIYVLQK